MQLFAIRHAESTAQTGEGPWLDPDLSPFGETQATAASAYFVERHFDLILISPLRRARRTYELAKPKGARVRFDSRLVECTLNRGPGYDYRELLPYETPPYAEADAADMWTAPAGKRVQSLLEELRHSDRHSGDESVLLIAHNGLINVLRSHLVGKPIYGEPRFEDLVTAQQSDNTGISGFNVGKEPGADKLLFWSRATSPLTEA